MKSSVSSARLLAVCCAFVFLSVPGPAATPAAEPPEVAAVRSADDARIAAILAADGTKLGGLVADDLHYGHSNGNVDDKARYVGDIANRSIVYDTIEYRRREFHVLAPGVVRMTGRFVGNARRAGQAIVNDLTFLAIWRKDPSGWKFVAWQSCRNPPAAGAPSTPPPPRP